MVRGLMGRSRFHRGLLATLLAAFIAVFGMTFVDAMACEWPAGSTTAATVVVSEPADSRPDEPRQCGPFCSYCQCHHIAMTAADAPSPPALMPVRSVSSRVAPADAFVSRTPSGPDRPPQG